jgi:protein PhnA
MSEHPPCPACKSTFTYEMGDLLACPECGHEWSASEVGTDAAFVVKDCNGNVLIDGDTIIIAKDLTVKGYLRSIKVGTKVKNIRLTDGDAGHNIDCKVDGFGSMVLKSEFVKKV